MLFLLSTATTRMAVYAQKCCSCRRYCYRRHEGHARLHVYLTAAKCERLGIVCSSSCFFLLLLLPNQQRTLNKLPTDLRRRNFVNNYRLTTQIDAKRTKTHAQHVRIPTELLFLHATVGGWEMRVVKDCFFKFLFFFFFFFCWLTWRV